MKAGEVAEIIDMFIREHGDVDICDVSLHLKLGIKKMILKSKTDTTHKK